MFSVGQRVKVIIQDWPFACAIGTIIDIRAYYDIKLDYICEGNSTVLCKGSEIVAAEENIMDHLKQVLLKRLHNG